MKNVYFNILKTLESHGFEAYIVGGFVRDKLLGKTSSDIDICTSATPKEILKIFKNNVKVVEDYGAVKLKLEGNTIDITTYRKEGVYVNNKPTKVEYIKSLKEDLLRRDFTINTICLDKNSNVIDFFDGKRDLNDKILRVVGDVRSKFDEDATRMLRSLRFMTVYDFVLERDIYEYIINNKEKFETINYVKRKEELDKLFKHSKVKPFFDFIEEVGIDKYLGIKANNFVETGTIIGVWAQLEVDAGYQFTKFEREQITKIKSLVSKGKIRKYDVYKYGLYISLIAGEILGILSDKINEMHKELPIRSIKDVSVEYSEVKRVLKCSDKVVGKVLKRLEYEIINGKIENKKEILKFRVKELYDERDERLFKD